MDGYGERQVDGLMDGWIDDGWMNKWWTSKRKERGKWQPSVWSHLTLSLTRFSSSSASSIAAISLWYWFSVFFLVSRSHSAVNATIFRSYSSCISFSSKRNCFLKTAPIFLSTWGERWPLLVRFLSRRAMISLLIWVRQASSSESARFRVAISNLATQRLRESHHINSQQKPKVPQSSEVSNYLQVRHFFPPFPSFSPFPPSFLFYPVTKGQGLSSSILFSKFAGSYSGNNKE